MLFSTHQNSVNPRWILLTLLNLKLLTINYRICISSRPEPEKNLTCVQQIKMKTFQGGQLSHGTSCLLITPKTEDWGKPLPHPRPIPVPLTALTLRVNIFTASSLFLKIPWFPGVCDHLKLFQAWSFKTYHQVFNSLSQKQNSDTRQRSTEFHYIEISSSLVMKIIQSSPRGWHKAAVGFRYCLGMQVLGHFYLNIT